MKTALVSAALLLGLSTTAFAAGNATGRNYYPGEAAVPQTSHVTRAEVKADLAKAQAEGTLAADNRADYPAFHTASATGKTRAEVKAEITPQTQQEILKSYRGS